MAEFFVTGTDTGVGKTLATAALLRAANARGLATIGLKPVAAGCERRDGRWVNEDALLLQASASVRLDYERVNPVALRLAMAPHLAAAEDGVTLDAAGLAQRCRDTARTAHDLLLAEGAGGWLVPLNERETMADLAAQLGWPVILVVGMRLGCLNHALLTAAEIRDAGLTLGGWVANTLVADMPYFDANVAALEERLDAPRLGTIPWLGAAPDPDSAASALDLTLLAGMPHARL